MFPQLRCKYNCGVCDYWQQGRGFCAKASARRRPPGPARADARLNPCVFQMQVRLAQLQAAFAQGIFERRSLRIKLDMETPHLEQISDAEKHLQMVERLKQKVGRTRAQRCAFRLPVRIARQDDDRKEDFIARGTQGMEDGNPSTCGIFQSSRIKSGAKLSHVSRARRESVTDLSCL